MGSVLGDSLTPSPSLSQSVHNVVPSPTYKQTNKQSDIQTQVQIEIITYRVLKTDLHVSAFNVCYMFIRVCFCR